MIFKTIVGPAAEGEYYFARPTLDNHIWKYIDSGSNLLVSAPRRVGKTSFLKNLISNKKEGYLIKYHDTESINRSNEYFKRIYKSVLEELIASKKIWKSLIDIRKRDQIEKIGPGGIELKGVDLDYFEELRHLIKKVDFEDKLVFIMDEFSETVENIITDQGEEAGKNFLNQNRELRQDSEVNEKIQFIYCGSIGLGNITERIGAMKTINDLTDFTIPPFSEKEALELIEKVTVEPKLVFEEKAKQYLINRVYWLMPFYIQIILDEAETLLFQQENDLTLNEDLIERAIDEALKKRNYFEHWHTRLRTSLKGKDYTFAKEVLNAASKSKSGISKTQIFDLSQKYEINEQYTIILRTLEYDGYISPDEKQVFIFNSPLLKIWWERNIAI